MFNNFVVLFVFLIKFFFYTILFKQNVLYFQKKRLLPLGTVVQIGLNSKSIPNCLKSTHNLITMLPTKTSTLLSSLPLPLQKYTHSHNCNRLVNATNTLRFKDNKSHRYYQPTLIHSPNRT